ncbi:expressed tetratricopeptide repeat protein [Nitzschia inconspicua]|uniref:Expressed tetratricopeptide repeat protein n=1 Tax=Nitzschia inconspicua TaxID=303405 RepID=A0A9K3PI27_9STRA|nr:expressed tetratricopeptide repeat protein [Nitzschia inconspicua]
MATTPQDIQSILDGSLTDPIEAKRVKDYIASLQAKITELGGTLPEGDEDGDAAKVSSTDDDTAMKDENVDLEDDGYQAPQYSSGEDYEKQSDLKMKATDAKNDGKLEEALEFFNQAVQAAPPSALLYANRAMVLEQLQHYKAAERDCNKALASNPDSAKALKVRGTLRYQHLHDWQGALSDLSQAQAIDYDPDIATTLEELTKLRVQKEKEEAQERIEKEEKLKKKAEEIKKAQEEARREKQQPRSAGSAMPGGGMPGGMPAGMPGMPDMSAMMSDPEIVELMQNPKVVAAFQSLMSGPGGPMGLLSNPQKLQEMMADPDVGPALQKLMAKFMGGGMGGMPGMGGGMGGAAAGGGANEDEDDAIPDMEDLPDLD